MTTLRPEITEVASVDPVQLYDFSQKVLFSPAARGEGFIKLTVTTGKKGAKSTAHCHPRDEVTLTLKGEAILRAGGEEYRILRDTVPWKYTGFVIGGILLVFSLICFVEERLSWRALLISIGAVVGIILLYDLPFDDVLLPPNGDV